MLMGCLEMMDNYTLFVAISFICRMANGFADYAYDVVG